MRDSTVTVEWWPIVNKNVHDVTAAIFFSFPVSPFGIFLHWLPYLSASLSDGTKWSIESPTNRR